jgi:phage terminase small subunit
METDGTTPDGVETLDEELGEEPQAEIYTPGDDSVQLIITPEKRREILGKLAEFEMQLANLTYLQQNFVLAVLQDPTNLAMAVRKAGYSSVSDNSVRVKATQLMQDPKIASAVAIGQSLREDRTMVTSERTINELAIIAFSDITNYVVKPGVNMLEVKEGVPEYALRAVSQAEFKTTVVDKPNGDVQTTYNVKIKLWNKTDALRLLALYQKLVSGEGGTVINNNTVNQQQNTWNFGGKEIPL